MAPPPSTLACGVLAILLSTGAATARVQDWPEASEPVLVAPTPAEGDRLVARCLLGAARLHQVNAAVLIAILTVEGGKLGRVSRNTNDTVDIGPMQVNSIHLADIAQRWALPDRIVYQLLRDDFCFNVEAGAEILQVSIAAEGGDIIQGIGRYHSQTPGFKQRYQAKVIAELQRLLAQSRIAPAAQH